MSAVTSTKHCLTKQHKSEHVQTYHRFEHLNLSGHEHGEFSIGNWGTDC